MSVTYESLAQVDSHWALAQFGPDAIVDARNVANKILIGSALGGQFCFDDFDFSDKLDEISRIATAYEIAAIEGLGVESSNRDSGLNVRGLFHSAAYRAFELRRVLNVPHDPAARIHHVLHLSALGYCGDRWSDLRRWYNDNPGELLVPSVDGEPWDVRLLYQIFGCWIRLLRKNGWEDLGAVGPGISRLREEQQLYEQQVLHSSAQSSGGGPGIALRLIALYHWAKATELLAQYMLQGDPSDISALLDKHFEAAQDAASRCGDSAMDVLLRWLHVASRLMIGGSLWWVARTANSRVSSFVDNAARRGLFELLPPQRVALREQGLLDPALSAVVVDMPTSGGKTLLAQFRMLQALNQFDADRGWVAYVAPTKALVSQITRRLRKDFEPIGVRVEQLSGAVEVDAFEEQILEDSSDQKFGVLVSTPEKLQVVIKNEKVDRPLALIVMDEAHNIENEDRGLRIELLLATIKRDCHRARFLLLMPYVERADSIARWLAADESGGRSISLGSTPWQPNERIIGTFRVAPVEDTSGGWQVHFDALSASRRAMHLEGTHKVGPVNPLNFTLGRVYSKKQQVQKSFGLQTAAIASVMSARGTSVAIGGRIPDVWTMARAAADGLPRLGNIPDEIRIVQNFLKTEVDEQFELVSMLEHGVGVHHAGLSDEIRSLMEWLAEEGKLRVLCSTTTIAQGINFPVSSVFLSSRKVFHDGFSEDMTARDFWNLAGRAGRIGQDSVGVIGIADGNAREEIVDFVGRATGALASRLVGMLDQLESAGRLNDLETLIYTDQWEDFRCYVAHLWAQKKRLDDVLADTEQLLRNTYGYEQLRASPSGRHKAERLLEATRRYATELGDYPGIPELADSTGFSPEGVRRALAGMGQLENKLSPSDWTPESLFGKSTGMADLFGVMLRVPQIASSLGEIAGDGVERRHLADITKAWVNGESLKVIAESYFSKEGARPEHAYTAACRAIYRSIVNGGTWGVSALSRLSGLDYEQLSADDRRRLNVIPAMIYHGVRTEEAVLMRMNSAPRSISESLGERFRNSSGGMGNARAAREFLRNLSVSDWNALRPQGAAMSGADYQSIWGVLSGER